MFGEIWSCHLAIREQQRAFKRLEEAATVSVERNEVLTLPLPSVDRAARSPRYSWSGQRLRYGGGPSSIELSMDTLPPTYDARPLRQFLKWLYHRDIRHLWRRRRIGILQYLSLICYCLCVLCIFGPYYSSLLVVQPAGRFLCTAMYVLPIQVCGIEGRGIRGVADSRR